MPFIQNFPFFSIFLAILSAVICLPLRRRTSQWVTLACLTVLTALSAALLNYTLQDGVSFTYMMGHFPGPFGNEIRAGPLEAFLALLFCSVSLFSVSGGLRGIIEDVPETKVNYYFVMQNMLTGSLLALIYTNDLFTAFVFIEIITIAACSIVSAKPGGRTLVATIVYLIMSLVGSCLLLFAIAILYSVTGHLLMPGLQEAVTSLVASGEYTLPLFVLSGLFLVSLAIKSALFPFHGWLPGAHSSATTAASAVLSGLILKSYLILLIKLIYRVFGPGLIELVHIPQLLIFFGTVGILYGSWKAIAQREIKGMLSYASISQIGYISVAIGLNTEAGLAAACFHIAVHAVEKAMLFTAAGGLSAASSNGKDFVSLRGAARRAPLSGAAFILGGISMVGIPPFSGFFSKLYLTAAAMETPFAIIVLPVAVIVGTVLSAMYYFPAMACILSKGAVSPPPNAKTPECTQLTLIYHAALISFMALSLILAFFSQPILRVLEQGLAVFG